MFSIPNKNHSRSSKPLAGAKTNYGSGLSAQEYLYYTQNPVSNVSLVYHCLSRTSVVWSKSKAVSVMASQLRLRMNTGSSFAHVNTEMGQPIRDPIKRTHAPTMRYFTAASAILRQ